MMDLRTQLVFRICDALGETPDYYLIGKITEETNKAVQLLQSMPANAQKTVLKLLETYLDSINEV